MNKEKFNIVETLNNLKSICINRYNLFFGKNVFLKVVGVVMAIFLLYFFIPALPSLLSIMMSSGTNRNKVPESIPVLSPQVLSLDTSQLIEEKVDDEYIKTNQCKGYMFNIIGTRYIKPVGSQRFQAEVDGYSARGTEFLQASSETQWGCSLPFIAQFVAVPIRGPSLGVFVEYKDVFKVLIGDGDRKTIRVEAKKYSISGPVYINVTHNRPALNIPIEDNEEVIVTIKSKVESEKLILRLDIYHSKLQKPETFDFEFVPNGVNFQVDYPRAYRVGINDSKYKGEGSVVDLKTFSVNEKQW